MGLTTYDVEVIDGYDYAHVPAEDLMRWVGVPPRFTGVSWDVESGPMVAGIEFPNPVSDDDLRKKLLWLSGWSKKSGERFVILQAPRGRGKTTYAAATIRRALPAKPMWVKWTRLVTDVADSWKDGGEGRALDRVIRAPLLILDDFGKEITGTEREMVPWQRRIAFEVVNGRYEHLRPTVITTELTPEEMGQRLDAAITSRLLGDGRWIDLSGAPDYRLRTEAAPENEPAGRWGHVVPDEPNNGDQE